MKLQLPDMINKAKKSNTWLYILNRLLPRVVPFNAAHRLKIKSITDDAISVTLPYRKSNLNHVKSLHACALATLCEYATGLQLMRYLDPSEFRIVLMEIRMEYYKQGRSDATATFNLSSIEVLELKENSKVNQGSRINFKVDVYDKNKQLLCCGFISWQLKRWADVRKPSQ